MIHVGCLPNNREKGDAILYIISFISMPKSLTTTLDVFIN